MIFVTVGTHEQQFDRLIKYVDDLKQKNIIKEDVIIQIGYSNYIPIACDYQKVFPYQEMEDYISRARIVITHGGPSSFITVLQKKKIPIVVPRQKKFAEHINDHQLEFCKKVYENQKNIILIDDIDNLVTAILDYNIITQNMCADLKSNSKKFVYELEKKIGELFERDTL